MTTLQREQHWCSQGPRAAVWGQQGLPQGQGATPLTQTRRANLFQGYNQLFITAKP